MQERKLLQKKQLENFVAQQLAEKDRLQRQEEEEERLYSCCGFREYAFVM